MTRPRPLTTMVVASAALGLGLMLWWLFGDWSAQPLAGDGAPDVTPTWLTADDEPELAPGPTLAPAEPDPGRRPPPGRAPPEPIVPETIAPPFEDDPEEEVVASKPGRRTKRPDRKVLRGSGHWAGLDWRSGAVGYTDATATREVEVEDGTAWIGTPRRWVEGLAGQRGDQTYPALFYEAPRHQRRMQRYFIDRFEVKNHDYLRYLQTSATVVYDTSVNEPRTLVGIAFAMILNPPGNLDYEDVVAWQLFQANKLTLLDVFKGSIVEQDGVIDEEKTFLKLRDRLVPRKVRLTFYDKAPPGPWPSNTYPPGRGGYPVRDLSYEEALDFAHWDGRHIPTEFEWEYAARGPRGLDFPWGAHARQLEEHANGGRVHGRDEYPDTVPVTNFANAASWVGCWNMLGNVSEWTSSFLWPYPDAGDDLTPAPGRFVVIRGGSAADEDPLYLRSAYRGWSKDGWGVGWDEILRSQVPEALHGPLPRVRLPWTGFRTARYEEVGFSRTVGLHYLVQRGGKLDPRLLDPDIYAAWQGLQVNHFKRQFEDDLTRPGFKSMLVQPLQEVGVRLAGESIHHGNTSAELTTLLTLHELSFASPVLVGLLQNDLHLTSTWHFLPPPSRKLVRARCPPGHWFVALFQSRLCLIKPDFGDVFFITNRPAAKSLFNVRRVRSRGEGLPAIPKATLRYDPGRTEVRTAYQVQLYLDGKSTWLVNVDLRVEIDEQEAVAVRNWERGERTVRRPAR